MTPTPTIGRIVLYRSRTGQYTVPAIITATSITLNPSGVKAGGVAPLTDSQNVHLTVFTPGKPGLRGNAQDFVGRADAPISENVAGCYQEWDVPPASEHGPLADRDGQEPGSYRWPVV